MNTGTTGNRMFVPALRTLVLASSWALEASGNDAPSDARSLGRDNLDLTAWRDVAKRCLNDSWGSPSPVRRRDGKSAVEAVTGPRLLGNGHLQFTLLASSAGNTYTAWVRSYDIEQDGIIAGGYVLDHWNRSYSVFARVPRAGRYVLLLQLDWEMCDGVREDGLREDSVLGFDVGTSQGILPGHSLLPGGREWTKAETEARTVEWKHLAARFPYRGLRHPPHAFAVGATGLQEARCTAKLALAPGHYRLVEPHQRGQWVKAVCGPRSSPFNLTEIATVIGVGDSRVGNFLACLSKPMPGCEDGLRQSMVTADAAFLARWDSARNRSFQRVLEKNRVQKTRELTVHVRVNGLDPNISITLNLLMQVKGVVCGVARPFSEGSIDQASRHLGIPFLGNAKQPEKQALVSRYVENTLCPGVPREAKRRVLVLVSCGVHCAFRSPLHVYMSWVSETAKMMRRFTHEGYGKWVWQEAPGAAEYAYQAATSGSAAEDFSWKHWRMTDARVRLFDVFAMHEMAAAGIPVLRGFYWPGKVWPKTAWQVSPRRKHDLVGGQEWWPNRPASFEDRGTDSRHFAREVDLAPIGNDLFFRA